MGFLSIWFPLFGAAVLLLYYAVPETWAWRVLLLGSLLFLGFCGAEHLLFFLFITAAACLAVRGWWVFYLVISLGALAFCKVRLTLAGTMLPMGISFYLFQSLGYVAQVRRGEIEPEGNPGKLAHFLGFFPQLVQGPIRNYRDDLLRRAPFDSRRAIFGAQRMLWGYFKKLVVADRIAIAVGALRGGGGSFLLLTVFYAIQIYGDFTGGMDIALGYAGMLGINLPENFRQPFFSRSVAEYWRRWHITLGEWMKSYIFYPLSVSRPLRRLGKVVRKTHPRLGKRLPVYAAAAATWLATGLWHGITPNFLLWGLTNCAVILASQELAPVFARNPWKSRRWFPYFQMIRTFFLMNFIRAMDLFPNVGDYFQALGSVFSFSPLPELGLTGADFGVLAACCAGMAGVSIFQATRGHVREALWSRPGLDFALTAGLFLAVLILGCYGIGFDAKNFIYNQF